MFVVILEGQTLVIQQRHKTFRQENTTQQKAAQ